MAIIAKRCGIKFDPPSVILIYEDEHTSKLRKRVMPVRSFSQFSDCSRAAERLKLHPRHGHYLDLVSVEQLVRLHTVLRDHLRGLSVEESLREQHCSRTHEEDLNKLSDEELNRRKAQMDVLFELNRRRKDDPDFVYDLEVEFPENSVRETCSWDQSDEEF
ncbi:centrosomal protein of 19 kDa [Ictalurus furcatus]|uniref:centrosomal protein of 19 kDa n=1 Tax=Ictalurus furcatus TaxID=66913 RepID=UPI002350D9E8|nr:centrosomal protein of 19 kDa [Ictalurus furcatus]XP_053490896.1 centrosomal protein of 19 kDa [Ictalurus furcatus]